MRSLRWTSHAWKDGAETRPIGADHNKPLDLTRSAFFARGLSVGTPWAKAKIWGAGPIP